MWFRLFLLSKEEVVKLGSCCFISRFTCFFGCFFFGLDQSSADKLHINCNVLASFVCSVFAVYSAFSLFPSDDTIGLKKDERTPLTFLHEHPVKLKELRNPTHTHVLKEKHSCSLQGHFTKKIGLQVDNRFHGVIKTWSAFL